LEVIITLLNIIQITQTYIKFTSLFLNSCSGVGLFFTLFTCITFMKFNTTPIIMASGRELCYVLLLGIALCYLMTFIILAKPSFVTCILLRVGLGLCLCICYSAIFTKTNRISRIFNRKTTSIQRPSYTSPRSQIVICFGKQKYREMISYNELEIASISTFINCIELNPMVTFVFVHESDFIIFAPLKPSYS